MSTKTAIVRVRLEPKLKKETELIFEELGINTTEAIRIFFTQVRLQRRLPFGLKIPNQPTQKTILDAKSKKDIKSFDSAEELFENLDI